ncbi:MAG: hypothetical protein JRD00_12020 [Deltaproteobacteria bacterium]|nr:hypothetical protein [Deltaproteobacteria bacterium]
MSYVFCNGTQRFFWTFTGWRAKLPECEKPYHIYRFTIDHDELVSIRTLARMFHELLSRDRKDGRATWQPQGVGSEAYLNGTSQGATPEDARKDDHIRGRSK